LQPWITRNTLHPQKMGGAYKAIVRGALDPRIVSACSGETHEQPAWTTAMAQPSASLVGWIGIAADSVTGVVAGTIMPEGALDHLRVETN